MNAFNTVVKFFQDSGMFIYPSILIMALGVAVAIERFIFLSRVTGGNKRLWAELAPLLQSGDVSKAMQVAEGTKFKEVSKIVK